MKRLLTHLFLIGTIFYGTEQYTLDHTEQRPLSTDRIFYRFYLLQRVKPAVALFLTIINEQMLHDMATLERICSFQADQLELFVHPRIQKEIFHICEHHDTKTLVRLIETVNQYRYIHDDEYVKEVVMLLLLVYENSIEFLKKQMTLEQKNRLATQERFTLVAHLPMGTISVDTLLNMLDNACDQFTRLYYAQTHGSYYYWKPFTKFLTAAWNYVWHIKK